MTDTFSLDKTILRHDSAGKNPLQMGHAKDGLESVSKASAIYPDANHLLVITMLFVMFKEEVERQNRLIIRIASNINPKWHLVEKHEFRYVLYHFISPTMNMETLLNLQDFYWRRMN